MKFAHRRIAGKVCSNYSHFDRQILVFRKASGFTMVEIALCLAIIGFALVAIIGVMPTGFQVQKNNRDDTIINQEGAFFLEAIRSGTWGGTDLAAYVDEMKIIRNPPMPGNEPPIMLNNGLRILGRLATPKYENIKGRIYTNSVLAKVRAIAGSASDKGASVPAKQFAFNYLLESEVVPYTVSSMPTNLVVADLTPRQAYLRQQFLSSNLFEIKLTFRWPVFDKRFNQPPPVGLVTNWMTGANVRVFRALVSGSLVMSNDFAQGGQSQLYYFKPAQYQR